MHVPVDRAGDDVEPACVELDRAAQPEADGRDPLTRDRHVCDGRLLRRDDEAAPDHEVVRQRASTLVR